MPKKVVKGKKYPNLGQKVPFWVFTVYGTMALVVKVGGVADRHDISMFETVKAEKGKKRT